MNKRQVIAAVCLFLPGIANLVYWVIYWAGNKELAHTNYPLFIASYANSLPAVLKPLFPTWITVLSIVLLLLSGALFFNQRKNNYTVIGTIAVILSAWHLFSLM